MHLITRIPKAGSTSLGVIIRMRGSCAYHLGGSLLSSYGPNEPDQMPCRIIGSITQYGIRRSRSAVVVRNPFARVVSFVFDKGLDWTDDPTCEQPDPEPLTKERAQHKVRQALLMYATFRASGWTATDLFNDEGVWQPSTTDFRMWHLAPAMIPEFAVLDHSFIGRLERFPVDYRNAMKVLGVRREHRIPLRRQTKHDHYSVYYTKETRAIAEEIYAEDCSELGYTY